MPSSSVFSFALLALSLDITNAYTSSSWSSDMMTSPTLSLDPSPTSWSTSCSTSWSTSWSNSWTTSWTTTTSTSTTTTTSTTSTSSSSSAALAAATPTSDCINNESYQADNYCGCSYSMTCGTHPIYDDSTILLGIYSLGSLTDNHMDYCSEQCDVDYLCLSVVVNVEEQRCYMYNELPIGGTADTNYDLAVRVNNGPGSCVNDQVGVCLANIPTRKW
ncbi:hypothetical protein AYL99_10812 [Fonsecaea erecta]|uniref:Apple domain-containing protein n=1 Tax=Fonsecaea erecta TaxID=1367422 RepID=A0A178Z5X2_9EURO|nr:hypothetical protein AYL99_10812 [Fonsecaea erecta]OAP55112.1 hypothetical protein AYL99_10812 [Fonsecaea erecta]